MSNKKIKILQILFKLSTYQYWSIAKINKDVVVDPMPFSSHRKRGSSHSHRYLNSIYPFSTFCPKVAVHCLNESLCDKKQSCEGSELP